MNLTGASHATATRDLTNLVLKGALIKTGQLKGTRYSLNLPMPPRTAATTAEADSGVSKTGVSSI